MPRLQSEVVLGGRPVMWVTGNCSTCISMGGLQLFCIKQLVWQSGNPQSNPCQTPTTTQEDVGLWVTCRCRNAALKPESELASCLPCSYQLSNAVLEMGLSGKEKARRARRRIFEDLDFKFMCVFAQLSNHPPFICIFWEFLRLLLSCTDTFFEINILHILCWMLLLYIIVAG